jgi:hypothetical protein
MAKLPTATCFVQSRHRSRPLESQCKPPSKDAIDKFGEHRYAVAQQRRSPRFDGRVEDQVRYYLHQAGQLPFRPDIIRKVGGTTAAVIDAEYKAVGMIRQLSPV